MVLLGKRNVARRILAIANSRKVVGQFIDRERPGENQRGRLDYLRGDA